MEITVQQFARSVRTSMEIAEVWHPHIVRAMAYYSIDKTAGRIAGFCAQMSVECDGFTRFTENLNYSAEAMAETWPSRYSMNPKAKGVKKIPNALALSIGRVGNKPCDQKRLAILTYGDRYGNDPRTEDGWTYRGRGPKQITFKDNYRECGQAIELDLLAKPELLLLPEFGARSAAWFWASRGCNELMDAGKMVEVTEAINGGRIGLDKRLMVWAIAKQVLPVEVTVTA